MALSTSAFPQVTAADDSGGNPGPEPSLCNAYNPVPPCYFKPGYLNFSLDHHLVHVGGILVGTFTYALPSQGHGEYKGYAIGTVLPQGHGLTLLGCTGVFARGHYVVHNLPDAVNKGVETCRWKAVAPTTGWSLDLGFVLSYSGSQPYTSGDYYAVVGKDVHAIEGNVTDTAGDRLAGLRVKVFGPKKSTSAMTNNAGSYYALVPVGAYSVDLQPGTRAERYFDPLLKHASVAQDTAAVNVDFEGKTHTDITLTPSTAPDSGLATAQLVARALSPLDQPIPNHVLDVDAGPGTNSSAALVVCSVGGPQQGRIEPAYLLQDAPQYLSIRQMTDSHGVLTYQVYVGSQPGALQFRVTDPTGGSGNPVTDTRAFVTLDATVTHRRLSALPAAYTVVQHLQIQQKVRHLTIDGALAAVVQGITTEKYPPSPVSVSSGGDGQRNLLRAIEQSGLFNGLGLAPLSGLGGTNPAVLIYAGDDPNDASRTRVLDLTTAQALLGYDIAAANTQVNLPTRADWERQIVRGPTVLDFATGVPEKGLTYVNGLPYLPASDADLSAFDSSCLNRAPEAP